MGLQSSNLISESAEDKILNAVKRLLQEARSKGHTGKGLVEIDFNQGGVTNRRLGLVVWSEK